MNPVMVAGLIIKNGKLLLIHNTKHGSIRIEPPGGKVNLGEILEGALERELKEELGIKIKVGGLFDTVETTSPEGKFLVYMYFCEIIEGEPQNREPDKSNGFGWYGYEELKKLALEGELVPNMLRTLPKFTKILSQPLQ